MRSSVLARITEGLSYDDVLLVPQHSQLESRDQVDLSIKLDGLQLCHPIIPANMKSLMTPELARAQAMTGGLAIMSRFREDPAVDYMKATAGLACPWRVGVSIGVHNEDKSRFDWFQENGAVVFCVDVAHGDSKLALEMCEWVAKRLKPNQQLIAGNVATGDAAVRLWRSGVDVVKVGIGSGSLCTTRIETGCGVPQISALMDVAEARDSYQGHGWVISDGGIKNAGDCVKALALADAVMCGRLFAGCAETGTTSYEGSSTYKTSHVEGVRATVEAQGSYMALLEHILEGVRSGCSYQGCPLVAQLQEGPHFIKITAAGLRESYPHDVQIVEDAT